MKIIIVNDTDEFGKAAFEPIRELLSTKNDAVLGLATGSTPLPLYREMIKDREERGTSYKNVTTCNLDEYVGLPASHPES